MYTLSFKHDKKSIIKTLALGAALIIAFFGTKQIIFAVISSNADVGVADTNVVYDKEIKEDNTDEKDDVAATSLLSIQFPTVISLQQIIYTEHFAGEEFTDYEKEMFARIVIEEGLEATRSSIKRTIFGCSTINLIR